MKTTVTYNGATTNTVINAGPLYYNLELTDGTNTVKKKGKIDSMITFLDLGKLPTKVYERYKVATGTAWTSFSMGILAVVFCLSYVNIVCMHGDTEPKGILVTGVMTTVFTLGYATFLLVASMTCQHFLKSLMQQVVHVNTELGATATYHDRDKVGASLAYAGCAIGFAAAIAVGVHTVITHHNTRILVSGESLNERMYSNPKSVVY